MQIWFSEYHTVNVKLDVRIEEQLFSGQSEYQRIDVFKSYEFGLPLWLRKLFPNHRIININQLIPVNV